MIGVKSTAITWKDESKSMMGKLIWRSSLCFAFLAIVNQSFVYTLPFALLAHYFVYARLYDLNLNDKERCAKFFRDNTYFGAFILLSIVFGKIINALINKTKKEVDKTIQE